MKTMRVALGLLALCSVLAVRVAAHAPSGAIFTTVEDGSEVNFNHYPSKEAVYLDGGPGPGAPQHAAGLDDGRYVFQVTDPSGKTLLSTDPASVGSSLSPRDHHGGGRDWMRARDRRATWTTGRPDGATGSIQRHAE